MADCTQNQTKLPDTVQSALTWFRTVFVKSFAQGNITKKMLAKIVQRDKECLVQLFRLMDSDESGALCYQEFVGSLLGLGRGRDLSERMFTEVTNAFIVQAGTSGEINQEDFVKMFLEAKMSDYLFTLFDLDNSGALDVKEFLIGLDKLARTDSDIKWYSWAEKWFFKHASEDGSVTKEQFLSYLNVSQSSFADSLFGVVDTDKSGTVDVTELMQVINVLTRGSPTERLILLFNMYDIDGNGRLNYEETRTVLEWCLSDSSLDKKMNILDKLADVLFQQLDADNSGDVSLAEFEHFLNQYPKIAENLTISFAQCLRPHSKRSALSGAKMRRNLTRTVTLISNNKPIIGFWLLFAAVNVILFVTAAHSYWHTHNMFVVFARGAGQCLNFNSAFTVALMYRNIFTYLRSTGLRKYLPLDHSITAHKIIGVVIIVYSLLHTGMHVVNAEILSRETNVTWVETLFTLEAGIGWVGGSAFITGWILIVLLALISGPSMMCLRRRGYFQLFYWSHWLFIGWWVVLVIHAPNFWKWVVGPAGVYALEKLWRHAKSKESKMAFIRRIRAVDSKVSEVIIERPKRFKFSAGDYILIQIEAIAKFEWHPFTISSAPEESDILTLHVEAKGDWTNRLRSLGTESFSQVQVIPNTVSRFNVSSISKTKRLDQYKVDTIDETFPSCYTNSAYEIETSVVEDSPISLPLPDEVVSPDSNTRRMSAVLGPNFRLPLTNSGPVFPLNSTRYKEPPVSLLLTKTSPHLHITRTPQPRVPEHLSSPGTTEKTQVRIDGPYGSPSTNVYYADHAILIGAGIGVTPFASILQSLMYRRKLQRAICPNCKFWWKVPGNNQNHCSPRKVDFIWVTRTFDALEWFLDVLSELEEEQALFGPEEQFLNLRLHITSALAQSDIRAVALQMALELCYQEEARDPLCGLRTRIQPGRPNWKKVFNNILTTSEGKISVFYCGPPRLEKTLKKLCGEFNLSFTSENF